MMNKNAYMYFCADCDTHIYKSVISCKRYDPGITVCLSEIDLPLAFNVHLSENDTTIVLMYFV